MPFRSFRLMAFALTAMSLLSCNKDHDHTIGATKESIQGSWKHEYTIEPDFTMPPEFELLRFVNDSFYMQYKWRQELLTTKCPYASGVSYVKGTYRLGDSKLYLNGVFTTLNYAVNTDSSGCMAVGNWADSFKISMASGSTINLYWLIPMESMPEPHRIIKLNKQP